MLTQPRILLTGATGFVGSAILRHLLTHGYSVMLPVRDVSRLPPMPAAHNTDTSIDILYCELTNLTQNAANAIAQYRPDIVINCAWLGTENTDRNRSDFVFPNLQSTLRLLEITLDAGCKQWISFGSQAEYSVINTDITEDMPTFPQSAYGVAKVALCHTLQNICAARGVACAWLRIFASYGKDYKASYVMPYILNCFRSGTIPALKTPNAVWDYIHVDDVAAATLAMINHPKAHGAFNLGTGVGHSVRDIALSLAELTQFKEVDALRRAMDSAGDPPFRRVANIHKIRQSIGWSPRIDLQTGLKTCL